MRICLVSQEYPPETARGGIGSQTRAKAHGLAARGHDVCVVSASVDEARHDDSADGVRVLRIPSIHERMPLYTEPAAWLTYSVEVASTVAALHREAALDLVDFPEWGGEGFVHLLNRTRWNHVSSVVHVHGPLVMLANTIGWPDRDSELFRVGTLMEGTCLQLADAVLSSSECSADWCARHYGLVRERIAIHHTGVDTKLFSPRAAAKSERPTVLFVGRIARSKGVLDLLEACCALAPEHPDLLLKLVGRSEPELEAEVRERAASAGVPGLVEMIGFVAREDLPVHLAAAHVLAVPSLYEGGPGMVYLEAMACGLPAIACAGSGAAESIVPGETGLLVPPGDVGELARVLGGLLADDARRGEMGERALRHVRAQADSEVCLDGIEAFYRDVIAREAPA